MKAILSTGLAAGAVLAAASSAQAQTAFTWTGGYIGGHAAMARGNLADGLGCYDDVEIFFLTAFLLVEEPGDDIDFDGQCDWNILSGTLDPENDPQYVDVLAGPTNLAGYLAGVQAGYNLQFGGGGNGFVIGAEVAHSVSSIRGQVWSDLKFAFDELFEEYQGQFELTQLTTATLRAGFAIGRFLPYVEAGLAIGRANWSDTFGFNASDWGHGYVYGGGVEVAIGGNISLFAEYNRVRLNHTFTGAFSADGYVFPIAVGVSSTTNVFKAGFNFGIGG